MRLRRSTARDRRSDTVEGLYLHLYIEAFHTLLLHQLPFLDDFLISRHLFNALSLSLLQIISSLAHVTLRLAFGIFGACQHSRSTPFFQSWEKPPTLGFHLNSGEQEGGSAKEVAL